MSKSRRRLAITVCALAALAILVVWRFAFHGQRPDLLLWPPISPVDQLAVLDRPITFRAQGETLTRAVVRAGRAAGVQIDVDISAVPSGLLKPPMVDCDMRDQPLGAVLEYMLRQVENPDQRLIVGVRDDRLLLVESQAWLAGQNNYVTQTHLLDDAIGEGLEYAPEKLPAAIASTVDNGSWNNRGGVGDIRRVPGSLIVTQTIAQQRTIAALLRALPLCQAGGTEPIWIDPPASDANLAVARVLLRPIDVDFVAMPLDDALRHWSDELQIPIHLDRRSLELQAIDPRLPWTAHLKQLQFGSALRLLLSRSGDLTYEIRYGGLWVAHRSVSERLANTSLRMYPVADLQAAIQPDAEVGYLESAVRDLGVPAWWRGYGGENAVYELPGALLVQHSSDGHHRIQRMLDELRQRFAVNGDGPPRHWTARRKMIEDTLRGSVTLNYEQRPLSEVAEDLASQFEINVFVDGKALATVEIPMDEPMTLTADDEPLETALRNMLDPRSLRLSVRDETLVITSSEFDEVDAELRIYRVAQLLYPPDVPMHRDFKDADSLIELLEVCVAPESWNGVGGPNPLTVLGDLLPIAHTRQVHAEIQAFLETLTQAVASDSPRYTSTAGMSDEDAARLASALDRPSEMQFQLRPLSEVLDRFSKELGVPVEFSKVEMEQLNFVADSPISADLSDQSLGSALQRLIDLLDLECRWDGKRIRLGAEYQPVARVHRVDWLPADQLPELSDLLAECAPSANKHGEPNIQSFQGLIVVRESIDRQYQVDETLEQIRGFMATRQQTPPPLCLAERPLQPVISALERPVSLTVFAMPLGQLAEKLADQPIGRKDNSLEVEATEGDWLSKIPLTCVAVNVPLGLLLDRWSTEGIGYVGLADGQLLVATPGRQRWAERARWVYHVGALGDAWQPLGDAADRLPLPWHLQPSPTRFGRVHFATRFGKTERSDTLADIFELDAFGGPLESKRLGPVIVVAEPVNRHRKNMATLRMLEKQLRAHQDNQPYLSEPLLERTITSVLDRVPFAEAVQQIANQESLSILVEADAFPKGFDPTTYQVTAQFEKQPMHRVLTELLPESERLQVIQDEETLIVTSRERADREAVWRTYDTRPLAAMAGPDGEFRLAQLASQVAPLSWLPAEPPPLNPHRDGVLVLDDAKMFDAVQPSLSCFPGMLVIRQSRANQQSIERVLAELTTNPDLAPVRLATDGSERLVVDLPGLDETGQAAFVERLIERSHDPEDVGARRCSTILLSRLRRPTPELVQWLLEELREAADDPWRDEQQVYLLCQAVRSCGVRAAATTSSLEWLLLATSDRLQRAQVIGAMVHCGPAAIGRLKNLLGQEHPDDHWSAIQELRRSKTPPSIALPYMMQLFTVLEPTQLLQAMASFDESGREAYRVLNRWSQDSDASVRRRAKEVRPHIRSLFGDPID